MLSREQIANQKISNIYTESKELFNCENYQYICSRLENEFIDVFKRAPLPKNDNRKKENELRNLRILELAIYGARYKDILRDEKITSEAAIAVIVKNTACKLASIVKEEIELGGSVKRLVKSYAPLLLKRIEQQKKEIYNE